MRRDFEKSTVDFSDMPHDSICQIVDSGKVWQILHCVLLVRGCKVYDSHHLFDGSVTQKIPHMWNSPTANQDLAALLFSPIFSLSN